MVFRVNYLTLTSPQRKLSVDSSLDGLDLEVDVAPFVDTSIVDEGGKVVDGILEAQAEVFVGKKVRYDDWDSATADREPSIDLTTMCEFGEFGCLIPCHSTYLFNSLGQPPPSGLSTTQPQHILYRR